MSRKLRVDQYKISASGSVDILPTAILKPVSRTHSPEHKSSNGQSIYNLQGRRAGIPDCLYKMGTGAYITSNKGTKRLIKTIKD